MSNTLDRRITSTFSVEPDATELAQFKRFEHDLDEAGFSHDVTSERAIKDLVDVDPTGVTWYPGYFVKWFFNGLGYKEHDTYIGNDERLGPICISVIVDPVGELGARNVRALVRTQLGFHGVILPCKQQQQQQQPLQLQHGGGHTRGLSSSKRLGGRAAHRDYAVEDILHAYIQRLKDLDTEPASAPSVTASHNSLLVPEPLQLIDPRSRGISCPDEMHVAGRRYYQTALRRWGSVRQSDFFKTVHTARVADELVEVPFPAICTQLHNLEKSNQALVHDIDIVICSGGEDTSHNSLLAKFLDCLGAPVKSAKSASVDCVSLSDSVMSTKSKSDERLKHVLHEFMETERRYVHNLNTLQTVFIDPVKEQSSMPNNPPWNELGNAFPKIRDIVRVNTQFLKELEEMAAHGDSNLGEVLLKFIPRFEVYRSYIASHEIAASKLKSSEALHPAFKKHIQAAERDSACEKLTVKDFLIMPVQRLPRYGLLVKELLKHTPNSDASFPSLDKAYTELQSLNFSVNETLKNETKYNILFSLVNTIIGCPPDLVKSGRSLVEQFDAVEVDVNHFKEMRNITVILFSDAVMIARRKTSSAFSKKAKAELHFCAFYELGRMHLVSLADRGLPDGFQIEAFITVKKHGAIKLGPDSGIKKSSKIGGRFRSSNTQTVSAEDLATHAEPEEDETRVVRSFKLPSGETQNFFLAYRKVLESLTPRQYSAAAEIYRKWTDHNTDLIFHVYRSLDDYRAAEDQSATVVLYFQDPINFTSALAGSKCTTVGLVQAKGTALRTCFHFQSRAIPKQNLFVDSIGNGKGKWWRRIDNGFADFFINKVDAVCDVALHYDEEHQLHRKLEARGQLQSIVSSHLESLPSAQPTATNVFIRNNAAGKSLKSLGRSNSVKNLSRRSSTASEPSNEPAQIFSPEQRQSLDLSSLERPSTPTHFNLGNSIGSALENSFASVAKNIRHLSVSPKRRMSASTANLAKLSPIKLKNDFSLGAVLNPESTLSIARDLCSHIEMVGILTDGLYRVNANKQKVEELLKVINHQPGNLREALAQYDVHVAANAFKQWVASIPKAVICGPVASACLHISKSQSEVVPTLASTLAKEMPGFNYNFTRQLIAHLSQVAKQEPSNFMSAGKLAEAWGPIVLRTQLKQSSENGALQMHTLKTIIENFDEIFKPSGETGGRNSPIKLFASDSVLAAPNETDFNVPAVCLLPRRSLDGLLSTTAEELKVVTSRNSRGSLPSIDEGFHSLVNMTPLSESLQRTSSLMVPRPAHSNQGSPTPKSNGTDLNNLKKRGSLDSQHRVGRVPVRYDSDETLDQVSARLSLQREANLRPSNTITRREPQAGIPRPRHSTASVAIANNARRSISMPIEGAKALREAMVKVCENSQALLESEKAKMAQELESLNRQIRNLKKALENEIRYKNSRSSSQETSEKLAGPQLTRSASMSASSAKKWESLDDELAKIQETYCSQMSQVGLQYDQFSREINNIVEIHRQMEHESMKSQVYINELEDENEKLRTLQRMDAESWKREAVEMMEELSHYKKLAKTLQEKQDTAAN